MFNCGMCRNFANTDVEFGYCNDRLVDASSLCKNFVPYPDSGPAYDKVMEIWRKNEWQQSLNTPTTQNE